MMMKRLTLNCIVALLCLNAQACTPTSQDNATTAVAPDSMPAETAPKKDMEQDTTPLGAKALIACYPQFIKAYKNNTIVLADGRALPYNDGKAKTHEEQMDNADIEDMFAQAYDTTIWQPTKNYEPGRIRNEELMKYMYGKSANDVKKHLVGVKWFKQQLPFTSINGAADSLRAVAKDLEKLPAQFHKYFDQSSSFYWRTVRGSQRLSAHSYGMTIDICTKYSDFWRWKNPGKNESDDIVYVNRIPKEIVKIFEKHGFVSGVRWYHFDTMHFEFRPDLLKASGM